MTGNRLSQYCWRAVPNNSPPFQPNNKRNHHVVMYNRKWLPNKFSSSAAQYKRNHHFLMYDRKWLLQHCWRTVPCDDTYVPLYCYANASN
jgi:hypothetical protein